MEIESWGFDFLSTFIQIEIWVFLVGLMSSIFFLILKNKINIKGLLQEKSGNQPYSRDRLQLLLLSLIFVVVYLIEVRHNLNVCQDDKVPCTLPEIRGEYLWILGGSNWLYIWGKLSSIIKEWR